MPGFFCTALVFFVLASIVFGHGDETHPTGWINILTYNDDTCSQTGPGWITYACGVCTTIKNNAYYKLSCSEADGKITYKFANYTAAGCNDADMDFNRTALLTPSTCLVRTTQNGNGVEGDDFDTPYYSNAVYTFTSGTSPPSLPYGGYLKKTYNDSTCTSAGLIELKLFNQPYCYIVGENLSAKFNCVGSVTYYNDTTCTTSLSTDVTLNVPNTCLVDASDESNGFSFEYSCYVKSSSKKSNECFSSTETVELESEEIKLMKDIEIGDKVMVTSVDGKEIKFSPVIALPHVRDNQEETIFTHIVTESGRDVKMTAGHLVLGGGCDNSQLELIAAGSLKIGECIQTVTGREIIHAINTVTGKGVFTLVTMSNGLLVVNGIVASPFTVNHQVANAFYTIHRVFHSLLPRVTTSTLFVESVKMFGDVVTNLFA